MKNVLFVMFLAFMSQMAIAQAGPGQQGPKQGMEHKRGADSFRKNFYAPEMIMKNQSELNLSEEQRKHIIAASQDAQKNFTEWEWALKAENDKLKTMTATPKVDEAACLAQMEKILALEKQIKIQRMKMLISIKNKLNAEQMKKLDEIKASRGPKGPEKPRK
jgi:Spy/CpxP family protein refolding chaperone